DDALHAVGALVSRGIDQAAAGGVPHQHDRTICGVDRPDHRVDVVTQCDTRPVRIDRLETGKRHRAWRVARAGEYRRHLVPRSAVEPEPGNEDDVHARKLERGTDTPGLDAPSGSA